MVLRSNSSAMVRAFFHAEVGMSNDEGVTDLEVIAPAHDVAYFGSAK